MGLLLTGSSAQADLDKMTIASRQFVPGAPYDITY